MLNRNEECKFKSLKWNTEIATVYQIVKRSREKYRVNNRWSIKGAT